MTQASKKIKQAVNKADENNEHIAKYLNQNPGKEIIQSKKQN